MNEHAAIIVGGGPAGLMLAGELALARVDVAIVERRSTISRLHCTSSCSNCFREPRKPYRAMMSGLDIHFNLGPGRPLLGRRVPDLNVAEQRVYTLCTTRDRCH